MEAVLVLLVLAYALLPLILLILFIRSESRMRGLERDVRWLSGLVRDLGGDRSGREAGTGPEERRAPAVGPLERASRPGSMQRPAGPAAPPPPAPGRPAGRAWSERERKEAAREAPRRRAEQVAAALEPGGAEAFAPVSGAAPPSSPPPLPPTSGEPLRASRASAAATDARKWEERLGARAPVWIGAVALLLAGVFMVRYFAEQGLLGPGVRVGLAGLFGFALLGAGEWLRRGHAAIGQGLTAAGVGVLYAALLAAVSLHELIGRMPGFVLMAAVTAGAVGLSLRHGPFVALLGLIGGFVMPGLIGAQDEAAAPLFGYLLLLVVGLTVLNRWRGWWWLTLGTMLGGLGWAGLWLAFWHDPAQSALVGLFVLASVAAFVGAAFGVEDRRVGEMRVSDLVPWAAVAAGLGLVALLAGRSRSGRCGRGMPGWRRWPRRRGW